MVRNPKNIFILLIILLLAVVTGCSKNINQSPIPGHSTALGPDLVFSLPTYDERPEVKAELDYFVARLDWFKTALKQGEPYLRNILTVFRSYNIPDDIAFLPIIESGFKSHATSRSGAAGLWQFMPRTGHHYGLTIDYWEDQRRNQLFATNAAATYLRKLFDDFGDWNLALAAYNAGEGTIGRELTATGTTDFFSLAQSSRVLRTETKRYVPKMLATLIILKNPNVYGIPKLNIDQKTKTPIIVNKPIDLEVFAASSGIDWENFKLLNPALLRTTTPSSRPVMIYVPTEKNATACKVIDEIAPIDPQRIAAVLKNPNKPYFSKKKKSKIAYNKISSKPIHKFATTKKERLHIVKKGDTIYNISKSSGIAVDIILKRNNMKSTSIKLGQQLKIPY